MKIPKANKFSCLGGASRAAWVLPVLLTGFVLMLAGQATAQTFTTLCSLTDRGTAHGVILPGNTLYGTKTGGGGSYGTVFALNTDGTGFTTVYSFTARAGFSGSSGTGTNSDGATPWAGLILSGNTLYGTAMRGGSSGNGTVFAVNTDDSGFTTLHSFTATTGNSGFGGAGTNSDGVSPRAGLILSGNTLYGTAGQGGSSGDGTVFSLNTDGTGFTTLYSFTAKTGSSAGLGTGTNSDGANPWGGLVLAGDTLYGTAANGGSLGYGTVFAVNTNGTGFTPLHTFTATYTNSDGLYTNSDGAFPHGVLVLSGNTLYGTTDLGGSSGSGTVFAVNTDGTGFTTLYSFTAVSSGINSDGAGPFSGLILSGNTLYGTTDGGGSFGDGTVFSLSLPPITTPQLTITPSGANVIVSWPATAAGFTLRSTTNLGSLAFWTTNSLAPVVVNGQNFVTNPISGAHQFFRLSQ